MSNSEKLGLGRSFNEITESTNNTDKTAIGITIEKADEIRDRINKDPLTRLTRKEVWNDKLVETLKDNPDSKIVVLFIDLKDFKKVNDTKGHDMGDEVLIYSAEVISDSFRDRDTIAISFESEEERLNVGRNGGDEFGVILNLGRISDEECKNITDMVSARISENFHQGEVAKTTGVGITIGSAIWDGNEPARELVHRSDMSMLEEKERQRTEQGSYR